LVAIFAHPFLYWHLPILPKETTILVVGLPMYSEKGALRATTVLKTIEAVVFLNIAFVNDALSVKSTNILLHK
jgi:hypothetical protein